MFFCVKFFSVLVFWQAENFNPQSDNYYYYSFITHKSSTKYTSKHKTFKQQ